MVDIDQDKLMSVRTAHIIYFNDFKSLSLNGNNYQKTYGCYPRVIAALLYTFIPTETIWEPGQIRTIGGRAIQSWGRDNLLPQLRENLVKANNIIPSLMQTKRDILVGSEVMPYQTIFEAGKKRIEEVEMPAEIGEWLEGTNWDDYILNACGDYLLHANTFTEFIRTRDRKSIALIASKKARRMRLGKQTKTGRIATAYWCGNWKESGGSKFPISPIEMFADKSAQPKFIRHFGDPLLSPGRVLF